MGRVKHSKDLRVFIPSVRSRTSLKENTSNFFRVTKNLVPHLGLRTSVGPHIDLSRASTFKLPERNLGVGTIRSCHPEPRSHPYCVIRVLTKLIIYLILCTVGLEECTKGIYVFTIVER